MSPSQLQLLRVASRQNRIATPLHFNTLIVPICFNCFMQLKCTQCAPQWSTMWNNMRTSPGSAALSLAETETNGGKSGKLIVIGGEINGSAVPLVTDPGRLGDCELPVIKVSRNN